jgi:hypothetical protein
MVMMKDQVRTNFTLRFGGHLDKHHTKEGIIEAYLAHISAEKAPSKAASLGPKIL